jgi:hypothetical protein
MMVVMVATVSAITMPAATRGPTVVKAGTMKAAVIVDIAALVEITAAKAPVVVETATDP